MANGSGVMSTVRRPAPSTTSRRGLGSTDHRRRAAKRHTRRATARPSPPSAPPAGTSTVPARPRNSATSREEEERDEGPARHRTATAAAPACGPRRRSPGRTGNRRSPCRQSRYRNSNRPCREWAATMSSPGLRLAKYTRGHDSPAGRHSRPGRCRWSPRGSSRSTSVVFLYEQTLGPARSTCSSAEYGLVPVDFALGRRRHLDVPAWRLGPRRRQHALPLDLRRQRRGPARARPLPGLLPALRHRRRARPDLYIRTTPRCR